MEICVFCASSQKVDEGLRRLAKQVGMVIAEKKHTLIYGGSNKGLMGEVAIAAQTGGSKIVGVVPKVFAHLDRIEDEVIFTKDLRDRKAKMEELSQAYIVLPGGFGTLDEIADVLVSRLIGVHTKPIVVLDYNGFYDKLYDLFHVMYEHQLGIDIGDILYRTESISDAFSYISQSLERPVEKLIEVRYDAA